MLLPYRDDNPTLRTAVVTILFILVNTAVFLLQITDARGFDRVALEYGLIPAEITSGGNLPGSALVPPVATLFSNMFCHGGVSHLLFNMLFLWIFGNNVEDRMSRGGFLVFYVLMGVFSALAFVYTYPRLETPLIGASGAISGVLGAYLFLFPFARIHVWMIIFVFRVPALLFLPFWFVMQLSGLAGQNAGNADNVAWISHIAGFVAGILLHRLFITRRPAAGGTA